MLENADDAGRAEAAKIRDIWASDDDIRRRLQRELAPRVRVLAGGKASPEEKRLTTVALIWLVVGLTLIVVGAFLGQVVGLWGTAVALAGVAALVGGVTFGVSALGAANPPYAPTDPRHELMERALVAAMNDLQLRRDRSPRFPAPPGQEYGTSHEGAEALVAAWMRHLGAGDAQPTRFSGDDGIDVISSGYIAQVKNIAGAVPVEDVRAFAGAATLDGRTPLFFTSGTYTAGSVDFAGRSGLALFTYDAWRGELRGVNSAGERHRREGL